MKLWGVTLEELQKIVKLVSDNNWEGNVILKSQSTHKVEGKKYINFGLTIKTTKGPGFTYGYSGVFTGRKRKVCAACWHVHRDIMEEIFNKFPNARIQTVVAEYKGERDFLNKFQDTYYANKGSQMFPRNYGDICDCGE